MVLVAEFRRRSPSAARWARTSNCARTCVNLTQTKTFEHFKNYDPTKASYGDDASRIESGYAAGRTYARMPKANGARVGVLGVQGHVGQTGRAPVAVLSEPLQADHTRDFLIALYRHKAVTGFILWGFRGSEHWKPHAAMFRPDWPAKPNLKVWEGLVLGAWCTRLDGVTSAQGELAGRATMAATGCG